MIQEFLIHNLFWKENDDFLKKDPHLSYLNDLVLVHPMDWWAQIDWKQPGIYILTGGRQIGKTTSLKLLIKEKLSKQIFRPQDIFYLPCDGVRDYKELLQILTLFFDSRSGEQNSFLLLVDEITYVKEWQRAIKSLADEGLFRKGFCVLTGSDSHLLKEASASFPGRRGRADQHDFHLYPLSFKEYVALVSKFKETSMFTLFDQYLQCGGFLRAINDWHQEGSISRATYLTFEQWISGDFLNQGKNHDNLLVVLKNLVEVGCSQVSYSRLTERAGLISKETFIDYCRLLKRMDILFSLEAFDQNTKRGFPKKAQKFHFTDPFILKTIELWLQRERLLNKSSTLNMLVESCVASQFHRLWPTYYVKSRGEIDVVVVKDKKWIPIEVKWSNQIRNHDLKELKKHRRSIIVSKTLLEKEYEGIKEYPLPVYLVQNT
jgi:predicted AAA+ superfamily ATPase